MTQPRPAERAKLAVQAVLPRSAAVRVHSAKSATDLTINGQPVEVKWVGEGSLGRVRDLVKRRPRHPTIVVARRLSPGAQQWLEEHGIGWVDESGAASIALGSIVVSRSGMPDPQRDPPLRWTASVLALAEALLCGTKGTVSAVQEATGLSAGTCTKGLRVLSDLDHLTADARRGRGSARRIVDRRAFLEAYANEARSRMPAEKLTLGITWRDMIEGLRKIGRIWDQAEIAWAATGAAAAAAEAPLLTSVSTLEVYIEANSLVDLEACARQVELRPIKGGRLTLRPFPTVSIMRLAKEMQGLRVAPWPRVYADLQSLGVRGEEAAEHLREVVFDR